MNSVSSGTRSSRAVRISALLGTASVLAVASGAAQAQVAEVLITGSLIAGAPSVGVPVTNVGEEQYLETGAITTAEMLRSVAQIDVDASLTALRGGGTTGYGQNVAIHGFSGSGGDATTLMLINGRRWPVQGHGGDTVDPSIIPQLAVDRVDILTAGASAVYGSDAVTGVINVILKRNFEGAISQVTYAAPVHIGQGHKVSASHVHGVSWDTGNVTLTGEAYFQQRVQASAIGFDKYTTNFEPWGLPDRTALGGSSPPVISLGNPSAGMTLPSGLAATIGTRFCANCYRTPHGIGWNYGDQDPGPTTTWDAISANPFIFGERNEQNQRINYQDGWATPQQAREAFVGTLNQVLTEDFFGLGEVELHGSMFYSNRKGQIYFNHTDGSGNSREHFNARQSNGILIPAANPYRPTGMPNNARAQVNFSPLIGSPARINFENIATRYEFGLNFNGLPFGWIGDMFYSMSNEQNNTHTTRMLAVNNVLAALGNTIAASGGFAAYTKPAGIPYLNLFCDPQVWSQCNSPLTIDYITGYRNQNNQWRIRQMGANFSGPIFEIPSGEIFGALSFEHLSQHYWFTDQANAANNPRKEAPSLGRDDAKRISHAFFGQLNIPIIGGEWSMPGFEAVDLELGYRVDKYAFKSDYVRTPKAAVNWTVGWGLILRGAWGKSFRAPSFGQSSAQSGSRAIPFNRNQADPDLSFDCSQTPNSTNGVAAPGSATAILNPTCDLDDEAIAPRGIALNGGSGLGDYARGLSDTLRVDGRGKGLNPETAKQWVVGFNFAPTEGIFSGLNLDLSYFKIKIEDSIRAANAGGGNPNDPLSRGMFVIRPCRDQVITSACNAEFLGVVVGLAGLGVGTSTFVGEIDFEDIMFIQDAANTNSGFIEYSGFDFVGRYDYDLGNWGSINIRANAYYEMDGLIQAQDGAEVESSYEGRNSGARLKRLRTGLGWVHPEGTWAVTLFNLFRGHEAPTGNLALPRCYWAEGFGPGSCHAGSAYFPQEHEQFMDGVPGHSEFDLNVTYNTGMMPTNSYLQNINISLTINNVLDRDPPFNYESRSQGREVRAYDARWSEYGRFASITLTKNW